MGVFKYRSKSRNIYYAGFGARGQYFVRSLGTSNRQEAERREKKLIALAEAGKLPLKVSAAERIEKIRKSLSIQVVPRTHRASAKMAAKKRKADPEKQEKWIDSIKTGQSDPKVKAAMIAANQNTANNPVSKRKRQRSSKKTWKKRGHRSRVSRSMTKKWATDEFRKRNIDGRDLAAAERLKKRGLSIGGAISSAMAKGSIAVPVKRSPRKHGPDKLPFPRTKRFRIGEEIGRMVAAGMERTAARRNIAEKYGQEFDTVRRYDQQFLRHAASQVG